LQEDIAEALAFVTLPLRTSLHKGVRYPALGSAKDKLILIPGNHDRYEWERNFPPFYKPGGRLFDAVFKDYWSPSLDRVQSWDIGNRGRIFAVGADLCLVDHNDVGGNKWASLGQGKAHDEVIKEMEGESSRLKAIGGSIFLIWIIHFSPVACSNQWLRLLDAEKLIAAAARCGVHLILCGHLHTREWVSVADNRILFRAGTPTSLDAKMHCFHLVNIGLSSQRAGSLAKVKISDFGWTTSGSFAPQPSSIPDLTFEI
jgi:hypothetical protein